MLPFFFLWIDPIHVSRVLLVTDFSHFAISRLLCQHGACHMLSPTQVVDGLVRCYTRSDAAGFEARVECGYDVNSVDYDRCTALHVILRRPTCSEIWIRLFLEHGTQHPWDSQALLRQHEHRTTPASLLLTNSVASSTGARIRSKDRWNQTPCSLAEQRGIDLIHLFQHHQKKETIYSD
jgi:hypothetical protein